MTPPDADSPILVFADDWGRHPSSCQHLVRRLLSRHQTTWVNTIGTRTPKFDLATLGRAAGKFRQWFSTPTGKSSDVPPLELTVRNPRMWPWLTRNIDRRLNRSLLLRQLRADTVQKPIAITTLPIVADLMGRLNVKHWVYYCVDDFGEWPGLDRKTMTRMERVVVEKADVIISASENLRDRVKTLGRNSHLLTHGVDLDLWQSPPDMTFPIDPLEGPLVVFWGVIDRRMDTSFVRNLSARLSHGTIILAGPEQSPDPELFRLPRVHRTGPLPFESLPALAAKADVLIMPYVDQVVTQAMQPLKLKEYLATGKPVIARDLPANREWRNSLDLASSAEEFTALVHQRLASGLPDAQRIDRERLIYESWASKADQFERFIFAAVSH